MKVNAHLRSALNLLRCIRQQTDAIGVGLSFGKDSLATTDLCAEIFNRVEAYYLFRVRDMAIVRGYCQFAKKRWDINVRLYPHFDLVRCYRNAVLQPHWRGLAESVPGITMSDIEQAFRRDASVSWIALGWRRNDSLSRALILRKTRGLDFSARRVYPLRDFRRQEVYDYLAARGIPPPNTFGRSDQGGLDFHPEAVRYLADHFPADYQRMLADFPFLDMQLHSLG